MPWRFPGAGRASRKEPSQEIDGGDGHADAKEHSSENAFRTTFTERESQAGDDNCDKRQPARNRARKGLLENAHGVLPGRIGLGERGRSEEQSHKRGDDDSGGPKPAMNQHPTNFHFHTSARVLHHKLQCEESPEPTILAGVRSRNAPVPRTRGSYPRNFPPVAS